MFEFKEELILDDPEESIKIILDTPLVNLAGHHDLKMRIINLIEDHLGCMYIRDLLSVSKNQLAKVRGIGTLETHRLLLCLIDVQKIIDTLHEYQQKRWKETQCRQYSSQEVPVISVAT